MTLRKQEQIEYQLCEDEFYPFLLNAAQTTLSRHLFTGSNNNSNSNFITSPASGSSDFIYNNWKSNKTTYKSYNNIMKKKLKKNNSNK